MSKKFGFNSGRFALLIFQFIIIAIIVLPTIHTSSEVYASVPFTNISDTLSNSRFSFKGALNGNVATGQTFTTLGTSTSYPDRDTGNLFPGDIICFNGIAGNGCIDNKTFTINNVPNQATGVDFGYTGANTATMNAGDYVVASQSAVHTISFRPATSVTAGKLVLTLPANSSTPTNGIPDADGFDTRGTTIGFPATLTAISGSTGQYTFSGAGPTVTSVTLATSGVLHTITINYTGTLSNATTYTFTLGNANNVLYQLINPAPSGTSHTRGVADAYSVHLSSQNSGGTITYDDTTVKVNPVDGVLVSANVEQTLSFTIAGENSATACGIASGSRVLGTTGSVVPFGSIVTAASFYQNTQKLSVITNSPSGYNVTVKEDGVLTSGANTIPNTLCDSGACTSGAPNEWNTTPINSTNKGLGFSMENAAGTDASFLYNDSSRVFNAQPFSTTSYQLMSKASGTALSSAYVCYRLGVEATQAAGFYYNKLTYIATALF